MYCFFQKQFSGGGFQVFKPKVYGKWRKTLGLFVGLWLLVSPVKGLDQGFRFKDGFCQKEGRPGSNPHFLGECGNLTDFPLVLHSIKNQSLKGLLLNSTFVYNSEFRGLEMDHLSGRRSIFMQSQFKDLEAPFLDLRASHFKEVHLEKVNLKRLLANGTRFTKTRFVDCGLEKADFWGSQLLEVDFSGSDLRGADLSMVFAVLSQWKGARFNSETKLPFSEQKALEKGMIKVE